MLLETNIFLSKDEAAAFLHISPRTLSRWHAEGSGPPRIKRGRIILYSQDSLAKWLHRQEREDPRSRA